MSEPIEDNAEVLLEPPLASTLHIGLASLPTPAPKSGFNSQVLELLTAGREFASWPQQVSLRLRWMSIPIVAGFVLTLALMGWMFRPVPTRAGSNIVPHTLAAPTLPSLPDLQPGRNRPSPGQRGE
jgi:hypothetical protein